MRLWRKLPALVLFPMLPVIAAPNSDLIQVTGVRGWPHPDSTRVIVQTSGPFEYRADRAVNPDRLFFDILHAIPSIDGKRIASQEVGGPLVRRVRIAETAPGTTRIVFDLIKPADYVVTKLEAPDRMVIEFRPLGAPLVSPALADHVATTLPPAVSPVAQPAQVTRVRANRRMFVYPPPSPPRQIMWPAATPALTQQAFIPAYFAEPGTIIALAVPPKAPRNSSSDSSPVFSTTKILPPARPAITGAAPSPTAATASENATRSMTRALGLKVNRIVIDAGHGGHDDGTIGPHGVLEKDVVLDVSLRLAALVRERMNAEVVLTRSDDTFIPLHERTSIANREKADLFLSIHANSSPAPEVAGTETFFLNFTNAPDALNVAARENAGSEKSVGELKDLIQTITLNDKIEESHTFAQDVQNSIQTQAVRSNPAAHNRGVKRAPFVVLIGASMPSVLAEIGFLSNSRDENNLGKPEYRQKIAEALYKGLSQYSQSLSHFEPVRQIAKSAP
jgi:N-acetylmuramoyl-L-alanine amidase